MKLNEFVEKNVFESEASGLPIGETVINTKEVDIEERQEEYDGFVKKKFVITISDKNYYVPELVLDKIKQIVQTGKNVVKITRTGTTKYDTKYKVESI
jgi:hypothetical protein